MIQESEPSPPPGLRRPEGRGRRLIRWFGRLSLILALLALTGWNFTRSTALAEAQTAYGRADLTNALRLALDHLGRRPWSREAARIAARCLSKLDFADQAEPYWLRLPDLSRDDLHIRALGLVHANERAKAIRAYEAILKKWPDDAEALRIEATVLITQSRWREARPLCERLAKVPGSEVIGGMMLATVNHNLHESEDAVAACERVLALDPELRRVPSLKEIFLSQYAEALLGTGRVERARSVVLRALADKEDARLLEVLGRIDQRRADHDQAEKSLRRAVELDPTFSAAWFGLGRLAVERHRPEDAVGPLRRAIELAPSAYEPAYTLMLVYRQLGRAEEAAILGRRVREIRGDKPPTTKGMGADPSPSPGP